MVDRAKNFQGIPIPELPEPLMPVTSPKGLLAPEQYSWIRIKGALQRNADRLALDNGIDKLTITEAPTSTGADLALPCFTLAKSMRKSPQVIASELAAESAQRTPSHDISSSESAGPYLNYHLNYARIGNEVVQQIEQMGPDYGKQDLGHGETVVVDFSSPNVAKSMSIAHLRSTVIGDSICRINEATGHTVVRDNHLGDWGTQFGMLGRAYDLWADDVPEIKDGTNPIMGLYKLYVKMHDEIAAEKKILQADVQLEIHQIHEVGGAVPGFLKKELKDPETQLEKEGRAWFKNLEDGDPEAEELRSWATELSVTEFKRVYGMLGTKFNYELGEGFYVPMLPDVVSAMSEKGLTKTTDDSAVEVDLEDRGMENLVIQKRDGASLYATRDLATLAARTAWFNPSRIVYVVGGEQTEYFQQLFTSFDKLAEGKGPEVEHVSFGMMSLTSGKMSTRKGRVVFLEEVLNEAIDRASEKILEAGRGVAPEDVEQTAQAVGVGAVIYSDLGQSRERNIKFDLEKALSFDGQSAPYIQYARARTEAVLDRAENMGIQISTDTDIQIQTPAEKLLVKQLAKFPEAIQKAFEANQPSIVAQYTYDLADSMNNFYRVDKIVNPEDPETTNGRLRLTAAAGQVIINGLNLLGITSPSKM